MTVRAIDSNGDIVTSGRQFISGQSEVAQTISTRLRLFLGEYFRDVNDGTPWYQTIFVKSGTLSSKDTAIKRRILQTPGVVNILDYKTDYDINTREYSVTAQILTDFGEMQISVNEAI